MNTLRTAINIHISVSSRNTLHRNNSTDGKVCYLSLSQTKKRVFQLNLHHLWLFTGTRWTITFFSVDWNSRHSKFWKLSQSYA